MCEACQFEAVNITVTWALQFACKTNFQVTHSRIWRRISHGYDPASFVATRIGPLLSVLYPYVSVVIRGSACISVYISDNF